MLQSRGGSAERATLLTWPRPLPFSLLLPPRHRVCRCRQFGMWFMDGPKYFSPPGQPPRYLTYQNDVRQYVERLAEERHGGAMPVLYKQIVALSYQLAQFRCAQLAAGSWLLAAGCWQLAAGIWQLAASRRGRLQVARQDLAWTLHSLAGSCLSLALLPCPLTPDA